MLLLVLTRELALQTSQVYKELIKHLKIQIIVMTGGTSLKDDIMRLYQLVYLLVGTPGRVLDLVRKGFGSIIRDLVAALFHLAINKILFCLLG